MLRLRSSVAHHRAGEFGDLLREMEGVRRIVQQADENAAQEAYVFVADVDPAAADRLVDALAGLGVGSEDYVLTRIEVVAPQHRHHLGEGGVDGYAWVEVIGQARANSRLLARYLALINVAAVIAALGVITSSSILIVGAMAVSPDLLPICATCVGLVARRYDLAGRAFVTLAMGLGIVIATAAVLAALLALGAAVVLAINVSLLILSGSLTLLIQRFLPNRSGTPI